MANQKQIWKRIRDGDSILLHHRLPTCSPNKPIYNHPIANEDRSIMLIHNGSLMGYNDVRRLLEQKGHKFETLHKDKFTDTECFVHMLEEGIKKHDKLAKAVQWMANQLNGTFALAWFMPDSKDIFLFKHSNPIVISKDKHNNRYFSSLHWDGLEKEYELEDNEFGVLTEKGYKKIAQLEVKEKSYYTFKKSNTQGQQNLVFDRHQPDEDLE